MATVTGLSLNATTHYNQWDSINALNIKPSSAAAVASRPVFATRVATFTTDLGLVAGVATRANVDLAGLEDLKKTTKTDAAVAVGDLTKNCLAFAIENNLVDLKTTMRNASASKLGKLKDTNLGPRCTSIFATLAGVITANPVTALEYFTTAQITAATAKVTLFNSKLGVYQAAKADKNAAKKEFSTTWMPKMKAHVEYFTSMLAGSLTTNYPGYVTAFRVLLKLVNVGKKDQGLLPTMIDANTGAVFALVGRFVPTNYPALARPKLGKTTASGDCKLMKLKVGVWNIKFSVPGYEDQTITVKISAKEVVTVVVKMKPI